MRYLLLLPGLLAPMPLRGQEGPRDEVAIMAPAVKYMQRFYGEGTPDHQIPAEYRRTHFRVASATYVIEPIASRLIDGRVFGIQRAPVKSATQDAESLARLATIVGLDTIGFERAARECRPYQVQRGDGQTDTHTACRFADFEGILGVSLPVVSGDTARVEVWVWVNYPGRGNSPEAIFEELWEITLVREAGAWRAASHRFANAWQS